MAGEGEEGADPLETPEPEGDPLETSVEGSEGAEGAEDNAEDNAEEGTAGGEDLLAQAEGKRKPAAAPDSQADLASAIRDLRGALTTPHQSPEQLEAAWQAAEQRSGKTRDQLIDEDRRMREVALMATLEPNKEIGRGRVKDILDGDADLAAEVEKAMESLPAAIQANPKAWADAAYMALGKAKKMTKKNEGQTGQRRVIGGTGTAGQQRSGAGAVKKETPKEYPAFEQHVINRQFNGDAKAYEKYKVSSPTATGDKIVAGAGANSADKALEQMTAENT